MNDIYKAVTERILKELDAGGIPWRQAWTTGVPRNLFTNEEYRGMNIILLGLSGRKSQYWMTFLQSMRMGGRIRKGEKGTPIYLWHWRTEEALRKLEEKLGRKNLAPCVCFTSHVFNLDQVDGVEAAPEFRCAIGEYLELAENTVSHMPNPPEILELPMVSPRYSGLQDRVTLPPLQQFESPSEYYVSLFHELIHATGHPKRLGRLEVAEGDSIEKYSFEELVAEFGASFLSAHVGISNRGTEQLNVSYIDGWATVFRKDKRILVSAGSAAQRASDYITWKLDPEVYGPNPLKEAAA